MPESPREKRARRIRFVEDDVEDGAEGQVEGLGAADMGRGLQVGRVTVPVTLVQEREGPEGPRSEERELRLKVPGLGRRAMEREEKLNDLGYRMVWGQSRMFANRMLFLQKSCELPDSSAWSHDP